MKKLILIPLFVLIVLLTCCSKVIPEAKDPLFFDFEAKEKEMLDLDMYSLENNPAEYAQTSYQWGWASKGDIGYYHEGGGLMRVFNPKLQMSIAVCNKPNCKHDDPSCVARGYDYDTGINLSPQTYYKGYVYCIGRNRATSYATLYRIAGDGSTREAFMQLFKYDPAAQEFHYPHFVISQDAMYYVDEREEQKCLRRCPFEEKTQEIICTTAETSEDIYRLKLYGDFLFFQASIEDKNDVKGGIYTYNLKTGALKLVLKDALANYAVVGERIFYVNDGDIYSYDLRTAENIKVIDSNIGPNFVNNDEYIVLDNLEVYSLSGDYVCKLALKSFYQILGMDEEYILARDTGVGSDTEEYVPKLFVKVVSEIDDKPFTEYICED